MRWKPLVLTLLFAFLFVGTVNAAIYVHPNMYFGFANGCYINFASSQTFNTLYREAGFWSFDGYRLKVENGNLTVTKFFEDNEFAGVMNAPSGTVTVTHAYTGTLVPSRVYVGGVEVYRVTAGEFQNANYNCYMFNDSSSMLSIKAVTQSPTTIEVSFAPIPPPSLTRLSWFLRSDYTLNETNTATDNSKSVSRSGDYSCQVGFRIFKVNKHGYESEITRGVSAVITRWETGSGYQTSTFNVEHQFLDMGFDKVRVSVYMRVGLNVEWVRVADFETHWLFKTSVSGTWTFKVYTSKTYVDGTTTWTFSFGSSTFESAIYNIDFTDPTTYDWMFYKLKIGDFIGFIFFPFLNLIGSLFYGLITLLICVPVYARYRSITVILFIITLLGGAGGLISLLIPESGLGLAWLIFVLGLAGLIYKVFR